METDAENKQIRLEVAYALPDRQELISLSLPAGATVADAIDRSGIAQRCPELQSAGCEVGIWGHPVAGSHALKEGDRVELYRPLNLEPREARRRLAAHGKAMGQGETGAGGSEGMRISRTAH